MSMTIKTIMNADPSQMDGALPIKDVYCDFWSTRWRRSALIFGFGLFFGKNNGCFSCFSPLATRMQIYEAFLRIRRHFATIPHPQVLSSRNHSASVSFFCFFLHDSPTALYSTQQDIIRTPGVISMHISFSAELQTNADTHFTLATCQWDHV